MRLLLCPFDRVRQRRHARVKSNEVSAGQRSSRQDRTRIH